MDSQQLALVKTTWQQVIPIADTAADIFYTKLFELDGSLRAMFPSDLTEQKKKLMQTLTLVINSIDNLPAVLPAVQALGRKHVGYGVKPAHYQTVGAALLATLAVGLGATFTPEVKAAWTAVYGTLSTAMIQAS
jgi:hemoglobin-like flavoprotein